MDTCFTLIPLSFPCCTTTERNRAFCMNWLHLELSSIIKQIFIECLLCASHYAGTVGIRQRARQSLPSRPSGMVREGKQVQERLRCEAEFVTSSPPLLLPKLLLSVDDMIVVHFVGVGVWQLYGKLYPGGTAAACSGELEARRGSN